MHSLRYMCEMAMDVIFLPDISLNIVADITGYLRKLSASH